MTAAASGLKHVKMLLGTAASLVPLYRAMYPCGNSFARTLVVGKIVRL